MMTKIKNTPARKAGQIRGLVIEQHVSEWFKQHYSVEFEEADNYRKWTVNGIKIITNGFRFTPEKYKKRFKISKYREKLFFVFHC